MDDLKDRGNAALKAGDAAAAAGFYTQAISAYEGGATFADAKAVAVVFSNRAQAHLTLGDGAAALRDARQAVCFDPLYAKGHHRVAKALEMLGGEGCEAQVQEAARIARFISTGHSFKQAKEAARKLAKKDAREQVAAAASSERGGVGRVAASVVAPVPQPPSGKGGKGGGPVTMHADGSMTIQGEAGRQMREMMDMFKGLGPREAAAAAATMVAEPTSTDQAHTCANPGCDEHHARSRCSRCGSVWYCCTACQTADWAAHKSICKELRKKKKAAGAGADSLSRADRCTRGMRLLGKGEHAAAAEEYRAALHGPGGRSPAQGPGRIGALNGLGLCLRSLGDFDGAIAAHKEAVELSPQDPGLRSNYAKALMQKGDMAGAVAVMQGLEGMDGVAEMKADALNRAAESINSGGQPLVDLGAARQAAATHAAAGSPD